MKKWAGSCFDRAFEYLHETHSVLHLCMQGLHLLQKHPAIHEAILRTAEGWSKEEIEAEQRELEKCRSMAASSKVEIDGGYPTLHSQSVISLWGTLEALIEDLLAAWLQNEPATLQSERFRKIKVTVSEYESLNDDQRAAYLVRELARTLSADLKLGIGRFESILAAAGLSGSVDPGFRRDLFELSQIRNILVHRAGVADETFCTNCPWFKAVVGSVISVNHDDYVRYYTAVHVYLYEVLNRVLVAQGEKHFDWSVEEWQERGICGG